MGVRRADRDAEKLVDDAEELPFLVDLDGVGLGLDQAIPHRLREPPYVPYPGSRRGEQFTAGIMRDGRQIDARELPGRHPHVEAGGAVVQEVLRIGYAQGQRAARVDVVQDGARRLHPDAIGVQNHHGVVIVAADEVLHYVQDVELVVPSRDLALAEPMPDGKDPDLHSKALQEGLDLQSVHRRKRAFIGVKHMLGVRRLAKGGRVETGDAPPINVLERLAGRVVSGLRKLGGVLGGVRDKPGCDDVPSRFNPHRSASLLN